MLLVRTGRIAIRSVMTVNGDATKNIASCSYSSRSRPPRPTASEYPLTCFTPSSSIPRFPLLPNGSSQCDSFAEKSKDGSLFKDLKDTFKQSRSVAALKVDARDSSSVQDAPSLKSGVLRVPKVRSLAIDPDDKSKRLLLLNVAEVKALPKDAQEYIESSGLPVTTSEVSVDWEYWTVEEILSSLLPEGLSEGTPTAFTTTGHIAHLNLREEYSAYRYIIGQVILEKNRPIRTVVNKLDSIDTQFRFFKMEKLAGVDEYEVTVSESNCTFTFDFRTVYWNSRLHTEHERLVSSFQPYEVVSDVMAGVGPFAVPAAKKGVYVLANDLNPASYESMLLNSKKNKVQDKLQCYCEDGRAFIRESIQRCWNQPWPGIPTTEEAKTEDLAASTLKGKAKQRHDRANGVQKKEIERGPPRRLISHFVMNLPGSALEFLDAFPGAYKGLNKEEIDREMEKGGGKYPMVHVHCFTRNLKHPHEDICERANDRLGLNGDDRLVPPPSPVLSDSSSLVSQDMPDLSHLSLNKTATPELKLHFVRSVAPNKDMYCLSFRLNKRILFA
jgi:tRNA (guanine37-N1)-methyltransferase